MSSRYRCSACGNLTRFDVVTNRRTRSFHHFTVGGDLEVEEEVVLDEQVDEPGTLIDRPEVLACYTMTGEMDFLRKVSDIFGFDAATFERIAQQTKDGCPVSRALKGVDIQVTARLA